METTESQALLDLIDREIDDHLTACEVGEPDAGCTTCTDLWTRRAEAHA